MKQAASLDLRRTGGSQRATLYRRRSAYVQRSLHPSRELAGDQFRSGIDPGSGAASGEANQAGGLKIALAWSVRPEADVYWHDGGTGGYASLVIFEPKRDRTIVVLYNCLDMDPGKPHLVDIVAAHVQALMDGKPVPPLPN
jgi:hypothetical protein